MRIVSPAVAVLVSSVPLACTQAPQAPLELSTGDSVEVAAVIKGDEVDVKRAGQVARVRLLGIQAFASVIEDPELRALELKARDWAEKNLLGAQVRVVLGQVPKDSSGRYLAYVENAGTDVNRQMLEQGRAIVYTEYPFSREQAYLHSERMAREKQQGIWATQSATELIRGLRKQWLSARNEPGYRDPLVATPVPDVETEKAGNSTE